MHSYSRAALLILALVMAFNLVGCGSASNKEQNETEQTIKKTEIKTEDKETKGSSNSEVAVSEAVSPETVPDHQQDQVDNNASNIQTPQMPVNNSQVTPAQQPSASSTVTNPEPVETVTISIIGPKDHSSILGATKEVIKEGDTVMDVLLKAAGNKVDYSGSGPTAYVEGIDNVYEFDYGPQSGWTYKLNGAMIQQSAGTVEVKDGDKIVWEYVGG